MIRLFCNIDDDASTGVFAGTRGFEAGVPSFTAEMRGRIHVAGWQRRKRAPGTVTNADERQIPAITVGATGIDQRTAVAVRVLCRVEA